MRWLAVVAAVLVVAAIAWLAWRSARASVPRGLGAEAGRLAACPRTPNCVSSQADDAAHRVEPLPLAALGEEPLAAVERSLETLPRTRVVERGEGYLRAESTSLLFRFVDDVEALVDRDAEVVHLRSASRIGRHDLGANRRRVERLRETVRP